jgi:hypothetical protein
MGVRVLVGKADGHTDAAAMYCSTSGWMVGPIFEAHDAPNQIEAFLEWLSAIGWTKEIRDELGLGQPRLGSDGRDPREWQDADLEKLVNHWRRDYVGDDGWLLDSFDCSCGHHHLGEDGETARNGECASCPCEIWTPGNRAAEIAAMRGD